MARNRRRRDEAEEEWEAYACRIPRSDSSGFDHRLCRPLTEVYHVAHVSDACRIIEDRKIKAGLIGDESRLRKSRTSVCWLSANSWPSPGSLYGVIQFKFSWEDIIRDNKVYWVEAITKYRPSAYRFLITDRDLSNSTLVQSYDPTRAEGPLRLRGEEWYWSGKYTSEFMLIFRGSCTYRIPAQE